MSSSGYLDIKVQSINNDNDIELTARFCKPKLISLDQQIFKSLINSINNSLLEGNQKKATNIFWGAGHRSLTLISQCKHQLISKVVDSAIFKQGKFTPVSKIPIISPEDLFDCNELIRLFICLPGIYSQEVINQLKAKSINTEIIYLVGEKEIDIIG